MKAIVLPRQGGKTARMLGWLLLDRKRILIVMSEREKARLVRLFEHSDPSTGSRIVTIGEVLRGQTRGRWTDPIFGIDELDQVLTEIVAGRVEVVTFTGEVER